MLFEYAVEPKAIGSNWQDFRYLIEKFGFDRGRLISQFPKAWLREVYEASTNFKPVERKRLEESLARAKKSALMRSGRAYDPALGGWLENAMSQHQLVPFHAIVAAENANGDASIVVAADVDEQSALMVSPHTWEVPRTGAALAAAMGPLLRSGRNLVFVDPYFDVSRQRYRETLRACLAIAHSSGNRAARCEVHFCDRDSRLPVELLERDGPTWLRGVIPDGMSVTLYAWEERLGGEDFHARYLLTDVGGIGVEAGFSAEGAHQNVQLALLAFDFCEKKLEAVSLNSKVYDLAQPVLQIAANGTVTRI